MVKRPAVWSHLEWCLLEVPMVALGGRGLEIILGGRSGWME